MRLCKRSRVVPKNEHDEANGNQHGEHILWLSFHEWNVSVFSILCQVHNRPYKD